METLHCLNHHGRYSFSDFLLMSRRERAWLLERIAKQYDSEAKAYKKGNMLEDVSNVD